MGDQFDIQQYPNDPPPRHYLIYAVTGAIINPLASLIGFILLGLLNLLLTGIGISPSTSFFSVALGFMWILPICIIPQILFGALTSLVIGFIYGRMETARSKTPKQKLYFNLLAAAVIGVVGPLLIFSLFFSIGLVDNFANLLQK